MRQKPNAGPAIQVLMAKTEKAVTDRRQNVERRLRHAIRKAHDRMFTHLKNPEGPAAGHPQSRARQS
jgi:hypothetical protein